MKRKAFKIAMLLGLVALIVLTAGIVMANTKAKAELPEYVGSQACLGCHADKYTAWEPSGHANMLTPVSKVADLPGDFSKATADQQAELKTAVYTVAGQRFLARDPITGELKYLNVQWNTAKGAWVAYKGGAVWNNDCAGCHSTGFNKATKTPVEVGIGCEMCHGPGRDHIIGKGDVSKISASTDAQVCGQCHTGGNAPDGTRWPMGYKPGVDLNKVMNIPKVDPHGTVPGADKHWRQYPLWAVSAHANAVIDLKSSDHASDSCYKCHSADAFKDEMIDGQKFNSKTHAPFNAVTCVTCHDPHNSTEKGQLRMEPQALCTACHNGSIDPKTGLKPGATAHHPMKEMLAGYGAVGIAQTKGAHSDLKCVDCHMTEGNHLMKVIEPDSVAGTTRQDSCTACHTKSSGDARQAYLDAWQDSTGNKISALNADFAKIDAIIKANPSIISADMKLKYDGAKTNVSFITADGSMGAHNFEFASKILADARKIVDQVKAGLPK